MPQRQPDRRGPAAEGITFRINEGPPPRRPEPFSLTYLGEGVVSVRGIGNFAHGTRAAVDAETAARYRDHAEWRVEAR